MRVLVLNGGSSGLKALLCEAAEPLPERPPEPLWTATVEWGRHPGRAAIRIKAPGCVRESELAIATPADVLEPVLATLPEKPRVAGHRIVHGGRRFRETTRITPEVEAGIAQVAEFAPEHNRLEVEAIRAASRALGPAVPQVAVFDTAFHATLPAPAAVYPGPRDWLAQGIRRYGFHGISHRYTARRAASILGLPLESLRMVTCHLGNGASLAAVDGGRSIDTTMGFTPIEGLMMGTRSGSLDPGILVYLVRHCGYDAARLDHILNKESGLKGVSGISGDMREILAAADGGEENARLAYDIYVHRLCRELGGMIASLGGVDALVFTAGIGENCPRLREAVCRRFGFLGLTLDGEKNSSPPPDSEVSTPGSAVRVLVVRTEEDWEIARECCRLARVEGW